MTAHRIVVIVPVRDGELAVGAIEAISEALDVTGSAQRSRIILVGGGTSSSADDLRDAGFGDVTTLLAEAPTFMPGRIARALGDLVDPDESVILPASNDGRDLAPRIAAGLGRPLVAGAVELRDGRALVARAGGGALTEVELTTSYVATLQPGVRGAVERRGAAVGTAIEIPAFAAFASANDVEVLDVLPAEAATMDLADAPFIIGAGAGLGSPESFAVLETVAAGLDASVGATRVVTDSGWIGHDRQIGTTGVVVDPEVYVAFGISGAVQHTSGLGSPDHVIAVNTDPHCPMMGWAELAIVADAPAVVDALRRRLDDQPGSVPRPPLADDGSAS